MPDGSVAPTMATVSVFPMPGVTVNGMWRYRTADNVQVNAVWSLSQSDPSRLQVVHRDPREEFTTPADLGRR